MMWQAGEPGTHGEDWHGGHRKWRGAKAAGSGALGELQPRTLTWAGSEGHHLRGRKGTWFFGLVVMRKVSISYINLARAFILFGVLGSLELLWQNNLASGRYLRGTRTERRKHRVWGGVPGSALSQLRFGRCRISALDPNQRKRRPCWCRPSSMRKWFIWDSWLRQISFSVLIRPKVEE